MVKISQFPRLKWRVVVCRAVIMCELSLTWAWEWSYISPVSSCEQLHPLLYCLWKDTQNQQQYEPFLQWCNTVKWHSRRRRHPVRWYATALLLLLWWVWFGLVFQFQSPKAHNNARLWSSLVGAYLFSSQWIFCGDVNGPSQHTLKSHKRRERGGLWGLRCGQDRCLILIGGKCVARGLLAARCVKRGVNAYGACCLCLYVCSRFKRVLLHILSN